MPVTDLRQTVIQVVNRVQRKLGVNATTTLTETKHATVLLDLLNEVQSELSDLGDWHELLVETNVTASSSALEYTIPTSAVIHHIKEIAWENDAEALDVVDVEEIRRLQRLNTFGEPNQMAVFGVDSNGNPKFRPYPVPGAGQAGDLFKVLFMQKPVLLTTADTSTQVVFPADVVFQGLYAKALLEENGGERNKQFETAYAEYTRMTREALNRYKADTGYFVQFTP